MPNEIKVYQKPKQQPKRISGYTDSPSSGVWRVLKTEDGELIKADQLLLFLDRNMVVNLNTQRTFSGETFIKLRGTVLIRDFSVASVQLYVDNEEHPETV